MQLKQCAFEHLLNITLNWAFSFLIIVKLGGGGGGTVYLYDDIKGWHLVKEHGSYALY
jgi:hypothetical protein